MCTEMYSLRIIKDDLATWDYGTASNNHLAEPNWNRIEETHMTACSCESDNVTVTSYISIGDLNIS